MWLGEHLPSEKLQYLRKEGMEPKPLLHNSLPERGFHLGTHHAVFSGLFIAEEAMKWWGLLWAQEVEAALTGAAWLTAQPNAKPNGTDRSRLEFISAGI